MCQPSLGRSGITVFACGHPIEEDSRTGRQVEMERRERHNIYILYIYIYDVISDFFPDSF
jgi:hypothetical protein